MRAGWSRRREEAGFVEGGIAASLASLHAAPASDPTLANFPGLFQFAAPRAVHRTAVSTMTTTPMLFEKLTGFMGSRTYTWGERTLAEEPRAARLAVRLEAARVSCVSVAGAGYHPNSDNPPEFTAAIAAALESPAPPAYRSAK